MKKTSILQSNKYKLNKSSLSDCTLCTCFNFRKAARVVTQLFDESFREVGIRGTQFSLLVHAMIHGPITVTRLSEMLVMDRTTLARNLNPLQKKGLIEVYSGKDRRTRFVNITPEGNEILTRALPLWRQAQKKVLNVLGNTNWKSMISGINDLVEKIHIN